MKAARARRAAEVRALFEGAGVSYPPGELFLRAFKDPGELEVWAGPRGRPLVRVTTLPFCATSGGLGPKRRQGDLQIPEGFYRVDRFNPTSAFHLSLGLDYPNRSDRVRTAAADPGGDIFVHGGCATVGCLTLGDAAIELLYLAALDAKAAGQRELYVHILPGRLTAEGLARLLERPEHQVHRAFWEELKAGYDAFEETRRPPRVQVEPGTGRYRIAPVRPRGGPLPPRGGTARSGRAWRD